MNMRNKPCPCNSGLKHKKCCGSKAALNAQHREAEAKQLGIVRARAAEREREQEERRKASPSAYTYRRSPMMGTVMLAALALGGLGGGGIARRTK